MEKQPNDQLLTPRPLASGHVESVAHRGDSDRQARRAAKEGRIYKNRLKAMAAIGGRSRPSKRPAQIACALEPIVPSVQKERADTT